MPLPKKTSKKQQTDDSSSEDDEKMTSTKKTVSKSSEDKKPGSKVKSKKEAPTKDSKEVKDTKDVNDTKETKVVDDVGSEHSPVDQTGNKQMESKEKQTWGDLSEDDVNAHDSVDEDVGVENESKLQRTATKGRGAKYSNSAINFDYSQYESVETSVNELNSKELIKFLIVRAYNEGQHQLCKTLKQTLRAMNLECDFPATRVASRESYQESKSFRTNKPSNFSSRKDSERGETREGYSGNSYSGSRDGYSGGGYSGSRDGYSGGGYSGRGSTPRFGAGNKRPTFNKGDKDF
jgi:hypothetical protein